MFNITTEITKETYLNKDYNILRGFRNEELTTIQSLSLDEIETLEIQLTNIIMQLYKYRKSLGE